MDYAYRVVRSVKTFYNAINPATLSGAIDVIVVEQPDGEFLSTPFHVRFGKYGVFSHSDKYVDMTINGEEIDVKMKLGDSGVAYFVEECENDDVPEHMITSPLPEAVGHHPLPDTDEVLTESAKKLEEGRQKRPSVCETTDKHPDKAPVKPTTEEQSLSELQRRQNWPFSLSVFSNRRNRSLPDLRALENYESSLYDDFPKATRDDTPISKPRSTRRPLHHSKSQAFDDTPKDGVSNDEILKRLMSRKESVAKRKRSIRTIPINIKSEESDSEMSEASSSVSPSPSLLDARNDQIADGALSDSEVDRHRNTPEPHGSDVTDWKWGEMPETRENQVKETPKKPSRSSGWNWFLWRNANTSPTPQAMITEEGISLDELLDNQDPNKVEKYLGKAESISMSVDSGNVSVSQPASPSASALSDNESNFPDTTTPTQENSSSLLGKGLTTSNQLGVSSPVLPRPRRQKKISTSSNDEIFALSEDDLESVEEEGGKCYVRSLRLSSEKLKSLGLVRGANECRFSITTKFQGTCWCTCNIYLYKWNEQIVISDVDGTITKSDVLGHVIPAIGGTWAHSGVADLYTRIKNNGYKMVYLSSRAIGQSHTTKQYLKSIAQDSKQLPDGPVLLSPTSVLLAFRREVIERRPEEFKIAALSDLKKLFPVHQPFFAGFGNRETDVTSYRAVQIPPARILIIDPSGRVRRSDSIGYVSSYMSMATETVDFLFPPLDRNVEDSQGDILGHSTFAHWKNEATTSVEEDDLLDYETKRKEKK